MNSANIDTSQRLQRARELLSDGLPHTTLDIVYGAHVCAVNSIICELRDNGFDIECQRTGNRWWYTMNVSQEKAA